MSGNKRRLFVENIKIVVDKLKLFYYYVYTVQEMPDKQKDRDHEKRNFDTRASNRNRRG